MIYSNRFPPGFPNGRQLPGRRRRADLPGGRLHPAGALVHRRRLAAADGQRQTVPRRMAIPRRAMAGTAGDGHRRARSIWPYVIGIGILVVLIGAGAWSRSSGDRSCGCGVGGAARRPRRCKSRSGARPVRDIRGQGCRETNGADRGGRAGRRRRASARFLDRAVHLSPGCRARLSRSAFASARISWAIRCRASPARSSSSSSGKAAASSRSADRRTSIRQAGFAPMGSRRR